MILGVSIDAWRLSVPLARPGHSKWPLLHACHHQTAAGAFDELQLPTHFVLLIFICLILFLSIKCFFRIFALLARDVTMLTTLEILYLSSAMCTSPGAAVGGASTLQHEYACYDFITRIESISDLGFHQTEIYTNSRFSVTAIPSRRQTMRSQKSPC